MDRWKLMTRKELRNLGALLLPLRRLLTLLVRMPRHYATPAIALAYVRLIPVGLHLQTICGIPLAADQPAGPTFERTPTFSIPISGPGV